MTKEIERKCPSCGSLAATVGLSTQTLLYIPPKIDEFGNWEIKDNNIITNYYTCVCGQKYSTLTQDGKIINLYEEGFDKGVDEYVYLNDSIIGKDLYINPDADEKFLSNSLNLTTFVEDFIIDFKNYEHLIIIKDDKRYKVDLQKLIEMLSFISIIKEDTNV